MTKEALLQSAVLAVGALILYALASHDGAVLSALPPPLQFVLVGATGFFFHWLRGKFRFAYGGIELYIALFAIGSIAWDVHNLASPRDEYLIELVGSVYLIVRGLDNIASYQGSDPLLRLVAARLKVRAYGASA
ncbi:MAG TPA: hypothetical protein VNF99_10245 [Stellaceae bacterium]|nr:hypothetical protein [Stellaceae bacterium]